MGVRRVLPTVRHGVEEMLIRAGGGRISGAAEQNAADFATGLKG
jgi:hypothetical protein